MNGETQVGAGGSAGTPVRMTGRAYVVCGVHDGKPCVVEGSAVFLSRDLADAHASPLGFSVLELPLGFPGVGNFSADDFLSSISGPGSALPVQSPASVDPRAPVVGTQFRPETELGVPVVCGCGCEIYSVVLVGPAMGPDGIPVPAGHFAFACRKCGMVSVGGY